MKKLGPFSFSLDDCLGAGSFGKVYKGVDTQKQPQVEVAIKVLPRVLLDRDENLRENLFSEIKVMRSLSNPNIVQLCDVVETTNNYYIVQELCENGDLQK